MRWRRQQALKKTPMSAGSVAVGFWGCGARMVASGIGASMFNIVATFCPLARPAARHCRVTPIDRQKFGAPAVAAIRPVRNAKMVGWSSAPAHTGVSSAVSDIRTVSVKRRYLHWQVLRGSRSHGAEIRLAPGAQLCPFRIVTDGNGLWHHSAAAKPCRSLKR